MTKYTDKTIMPFGKHKGKSLEMVPASYLLYLFHNGLPCGSLRNYIIENMDVLKKQEKEGK